jgi:hypothetical protein
MTVVEREVAPEILTEREQRARTLEAAALEVEVRGWTQFALQTKTGKVCAMGAVACAQGWIDTGFGSSRGYFDMFGPRREDRPSVEYERWVEFNNAPERTPDEVTFALRWRAEEIRDGL